VAQACQENRIEAGPVAVAGGLDGGGGLAQRVAGLPGPDLGLRVGGVGVVEVAVQVNIMPISA